MGNEKRGPDIDLAVWGAKVTDQILSKIRTNLNETGSIPFNIDIIIYDHITNEELKQHILIEGKEIYRKKNPS